MAAVCNMLIKVRLHNGQLHSFTSKASGCKWQLTYLRTCLTVDITWLCRPEFRCGR